jgi:hypothetical protein
VYPTLLANELGRLETADARQGFATPREGRLERIARGPPELTASGILEEPTAVAAARARLAVDSLE